MRSEKVDISLWSDSVDAMAECLRQPDVRDLRSALYKRLLSIDLLLIEVFRLKVCTWHPAPPRPARLIVHRSLALWKGAMKATSTEACVPDHAAER